MRWALFRKVVILLIPQFTIVNRIRTLVHTHGYVHIRHIYREANFVTDRGHAQPISLTILNGTPRFCSPYHQLVYVDRFLRGLLSFIQKKKKKRRRSNLVKFRPPWL
ncbi:hypothetical protein AAZX31_20G134600 [Glycine max]